MSPTAHAGGRSVVWVRDLLNRFRGSLFGVPALAVGAAVGLALVVTEVDRSSPGVQLPTGLSSTVASSRALLGAITSGTIAAASVVFSLTLVAIQLSSSTYSSRVVRTFLRDRFQQTVIGLVTGSFAYGMLVLQAIRGPVEEGGDPFIPKFSILIATVLALASLLGLIASISHTAQNLRVDTIAHQLVTEAKDAIADTLPPMEDGSAPSFGAHRTVPESSDAGVTEAFAAGRPSAVLSSPKSGWIRQISIPAIRSAIEPGTSVRIDVAAGTYVIAGSPLLTLSPPPAAGDAERQFRQLRGAFAIGVERSLQQDVGFGLVPLEDIVVRSLSPGVNDPNTAKAVLPQLGEVVLEILSRPPALTHDQFEGCEFHRPREASYADHLDTAFAQIRIYASGQPEVLATLIGTLRLVGDEVRRRGAGTAAGLDALDTQLHRLHEAISRDDLAPSERERLLDLLDQIDWWEP